MKHTPFILVDGGCAEHVAGGDAFIFDWDDFWAEEPIEKLRSGVDALRALAQGVVLADTIHSALFEAIDDVEQLLLKAGPST